MALFLTAVLIVVIIAGLVLLLSRQRRPSRARRAGRRDTTRTAANSGSLDALKANSFFWGAELWQPGCAESYKLLGRQFTFDEAPGLPLPACSRELCTCQFKGLRDRRMRARRTHPDRRGEIRFDKEHPDRRSRTSRRRSDLWANHTL